MKLELKPSKPYRRVARPIPKGNPITLLTGKPPAPPKVSPKPGSKVYLYVYDSEPNGPGNVPQYYPNPHSVRQVSGESEVPYPYAKENAEKAAAEQQKTPHRSGRERVRDQARKTEKGYKVLAEVTPKLRSSSRGGKMFVKQRHRMDKFTKESPDHAPGEEMAAKGRIPVEVMGATDGWATPWNMAAKSPTAVQYLTAKRLSGPINKSRIGGFKDPMGFLPQPPDFWRAKVEQNFPPNGPQVPLIRPLSRQSSYQRGMHPIEINGYNTRRPDSAPPLESPPLYGDRYDEEPMNGVYNGNFNDGYFSEYEVPSRPASVMLPGATLHFNAKQYYKSPHRRQGLRRGGHVFTPEPHVQRDYNATAKGWYRYY